VRGAYLDLGDRGVGHKLHDGVVGNVEADGALVDHVLDGLLQVLEDGRHLLRVRLLDLTQRLGLRVLGRLEQRELGAVKLLEEGQALVLLGVLQEDLLDHERGLLVPQHRDDVAVELADDGLAHCRPGHTETIKAKPPHPPPLNKRTYRYKRTLRTVLRAYADLARAT